jgi:hypothetical protein
MEEDVSDIIQKIQEARSPKYFFWSIIKDINWYKSEYDKNILIGKKYDIVYFNYDLKNYVLYYDFRKIHQILIEKYHLNEQTIKELIKCMVSEHTKLRVDTIFNNMKIRNQKVSEHTKLRVDTMYFHNVQY